MRVLPPALVEFYRREASLLPSAINSAKIRKLRAVAYGYLCAIRVLQARNEFMYTLRMKQKID
jgi:hypothetical protein